VIELDCAGVCGGASVEDECGTCDADSSSDCFEDCAGTWGGVAELDCDGVCGGASVEDACGLCDADSSTDCIAGFFWASLGEKNGVPAQTYEFYRYPGPAYGGGWDLPPVDGPSPITFKSWMRESCATVGMKPVCDHPSYCKNDSGSLYIGQSTYLAYRPYRITPSFHADGFTPIRHMWQGLCSYTGNASGGGVNALCNYTPSSHMWQNLYQVAEGSTFPYTHTYCPTADYCSGGFICGRVIED
jgi:hypothetical protein